MKQRETKTWRKLVQIFSAFALVFSMVPIAKVATPQTAIATEATGGESASETANNDWYYWSSIYTDKQTENTKTVETDASTLLNKAKFTYSSTGTDLFSTLVNHVLNNAKNGENLIFDSSKTSTATASAINANRKGSVVSSDAPTVSASGTNLTILKGKDAETKITYDFASTDDGWSITFNVKGKNSSNEDVELNGITATYVYDSDTKTAKFSFNLGEGKSLAGYTYTPSDEPVLSITLESISKITDVQTEDANTLQNFLECKGDYSTQPGVDVSYFGVESTTTLPDTIYGTENYVLDYKGTEGAWTVTQDGKTLKVKGNVGEGGLQPTPDDLKFNCYLKTDTKKTSPLFSSATAKTNANTRTSDNTTLRNAIKKEVDLSYVGDEQDIFSTETVQLRLSGDAYDITWEGKGTDKDLYSKYFTPTFTYDETSKAYTLKIKRIATGFPKDSKGEEIKTFDFNIYAKDSACTDGSDSTYNKILDKNASVAISDQIKKDDQTTVNTALSNKEFKTYTDNSTITYGDSAKTIVALSGLKHANYAMSETTVKDSSGKEIAKVTFDKDKNIKVEPLNAGTGEAKLQFTVSDPYSGNLSDLDKDGNPVGFTIKVTVAPKQLTWKSDIPTLDYRYKDDQKTYIANNMKSWITGVVGSDDVKLSNGIELTNYPTTDTGQVKEFTVNKISAGNGNYQIASTQKFKVNKIESSNYSKLSNFTFKGKQGDGTEVPIKDSIWVNSGVWVNYGGHTLADPVKNTNNSTELPTNNSETYKSTLSPAALNKANDEGAGITADKIYAKDSKKVVTKITGLKVNLDKTAPTVKKFSVNTDGVENRSLVDKVKAFFFSSNTKATVSMTASDNLSEIKKDDSATVTYNDNNQDKATPHKIEWDQGKNSFSFSVDNAEIDRINENFKVSLTDNAGNKNDNAQKGAEGLPSDVWELVQNNTKPEVNIDFDKSDVQNESFYKNNKTVTVTITADHLDLTQSYDGGQVVVEYGKRLAKNNAEEWHTINVTAFKQVPGTSNKWQWSETFSDDADYYSFKAHYDDLSGEKDSDQIKDWTIDKVAPTVTVVWDNENAINGNYYAASRTATVAINEHNFDEGKVNVNPTPDGGNASEYATPSVDGWSHEGDSHICHVTFPGQGSYNMTIDGVDNANNSLEHWESGNFVVDTVQPEISITVNGEADASSHAYADSAAVNVTVNDTNVDSSSQISVESISWNGSGTPYTENRSSTNTALTVDMPNPANVAESDGVYRITVNALDLAGNTQTKTVDWSVNRFGSTYVVSDSTKGIINKKYVQSKDMSDVVITEINPSGVNADSATAKVAKGTNSQTVQKGQGFLFAEAADSNGWPAYSYTISKGQYTSDAMYQTIVSSTDSAGRASDNTMAGKNQTRQNSCDVTFAVDNTEPIVSYTGFDEEVVAGTNHKITANIEDNMMLDHAVVEVNGKEIESYDSDALKTKNHEITLNESGDTQVVTVKAYDAAGNVASVDSSKIFVNNDPLARLMHNTVLFVCLILAILLIIGGLIWFFFFKRKKDDDEDEQNTPTPRTSNSRVKPAR